MLSNYNDISNVFKFGNLVKSNSYAKKHLMPTQVRAVPLSIIFIYYIHVIGMYCILKSLYLIHAFPANMLACIIMPSVMRKRGK